MLTVELTLPTFAAERRAAAPLLLSSLAPAAWCLQHAHSCQSILHACSCHCCCRSMWPKDGCLHVIYRSCSAYCVGSIKKVKKENSLWGQPSNSGLPRKLLLHQSMWMFSVIFYIFSQNQMTSMLECFWSDNFYSVNQCEALEGCVDIELSLLRSVL